MELIKRYRKQVVGGITLMILLVIFIISFSFNSKGENIVYAENQECICEVDETPDFEEFYVDIKGAIKNPGVYLANQNNIVKDIIDMAGGLKSNATTDNINLSQKVKSEMVIYVCTKTELKNNTTTTTSQTINSSANITTTSTTNGSTEQSITSESKITVININTASKEELMTIPHIGESKADAIIIYRSENPFTRIEDIINVSGIGEAIFVKIKDYITV